MSETFILQYLSPYTVILPNTDIHLFLFFFPIMVTVRCPSIKPLLIVVQLKGRVFLVASSGEVAEMQPAEYPSLYKRVRIRLWYVTAGMSQWSCQCNNNAKSPSMF